MPDRYYSAEKIDGPTVTLADTEAHHLLHVMRAQPGLELIVFDGHGGEFAGQIAACQRSTVEVTRGKRQAIERELPFQLTLAVPLPKGDRQRWLVEKSVELGVTRIVPISTARTASKGDAKNKLERYVIEASKQCGRNRLMAIAAPIGWSAWLAEATAGQRLLAHPGSQPLGDIQHEADRETCIAIGPEGGFTDEEVAQAANAGWQTVGLGERILRIETAAAACVAAIALHLGREMS
ncbi:MAG: 16S rRNA (uracil(1498)-N(3))-methyltransferase [Bythopirellula sp.]